MIRRVVLGAVAAMLMALPAASAPAHATTCYRLVVTILDDPYFAHPVCTDLPVPVHATIVDLPVGTVRLGG